MQIHSVILSRKNPNYLSRLEKKAMRKHFRGGDRRTGFTLIELLIVLVILASLAALVVPMLGWARKQAEYATSASGAAEAFNNLELYRASTGRYPDLFDSLLTSGGQELYLTAGASDSDPGRGVWQGPITLGSVCEVSDASVNGTLGYYMGNDGSLASFVNHNEGVTSTYSGPNTSTDGSPVYTIGGDIVPAVIDDNGTPDDTSDDTTITPAEVQNVATVFRELQPGFTGTVSPSRVGTLARIIRTAYPDQADPNLPVIPENHTLVAVGIGNRNSAVGSTMSTAPQFSGADAGNYGRFIAFFDIEPGPTGRGRVNLKMVTDPTFAQIAQNIDRYKAAGPTQ